MKIITQLRFYVVLVSLGFMALLINFLNLKEELNKCKTDKYSIQGGDIEKAELIQRYDSLKSEDFIKSTIIGRYEITFEHLKEVNPKVGKEMEEWMSHNTE